MALRERTAASAAAAAGVATLMMLAACGGGGGSAASGRSATADPPTGAQSVPTAAADASTTASPGAGGSAPGTPTGGGNGSTGGGGGGPVGLLPSAGMTGPVGAAVTTGCKNADSAWSTFQSAYGAATSNPTRSAAATAAASTYTAVIQSLTQAVDPNDTTAAYRARGQDVARHATSVLDDLKSLARDLEAGDTNAAALLYSKTNPLSPMQLDEAAFESDCGD